MRFFRAIFASDGCAEHLPYIYGMCIHLMSPDERELCGSRCISYLTIELKGAIPLTLNPKPPKPSTLCGSRCISYLTIELKGAIPLDLRPMMGNRIYGCDVCQQVGAVTMSASRWVASAGIFVLSSQIEGIYCFRV